MVAEIFLLLVDPRLRIYHVKLFISTKSLVYFSVKIDTKERKSVGTRPVSGMPAGEIYVDLFWIYRINRDRMVVTLPAVGA